MDNNGGKTAIGLSVLVIAGCAAGYFLGQAMGSIGLGIIIGLVIALLAGIIFRSVRSGSKIQ